ncbi:hypothetical protein SAMN05216413_2637 [Ruminococcaceae bacterium KH2T8]|nr:hypothetical protein SAMN05216413_2637 [Ruminococcaceae bacterium KH2T8]
MSKIYVSTYEDNGITRYAIYDGRYENQLYTEDFKPVIFDKEEEALARLAAYEEERKREDAALPFTLEEAQKYAESHYWKFASTYAKTAPHEYCIKKWLVDEDKLLYERFVATMKANFVIGYFYNHKNEYCILGDHYYWFGTLPDNLAVDLINRTTTDYLELKDGIYYYKGMNPEKK